MNIGEQEVGPQHLPLALADVGGRRAGGDLGAAQRLATLAANAAQNAKNQARFVPSGQAATHERTARPGVPNVFGGLLTSLGNLAFRARQPALFCLLRSLRFGSQSPYPVIHAEFRGRTHPSAKELEEKVVLLFYGRKNPACTSDFLYVGPKAYGQLEEVLARHPDKTPVFPKQVEGAPPHALFFLNREEKSFECGRIDQVFSSVIPGARIVYHTPWFATGWPLGLLRTYLNLQTAFGCARLHVTGVDFYTSRAKHGTTYLAKSSIRRPIDFKTSLLKHDIILNFWVTRSLWRQGMITGDERFEEVMRMSVPAFARMFFSNI